MPLQRVENWATRAFPDFLQARRSMPFAWGKNDCSLFAADGIQVLTGIDIASDFRGQYDNHVDALTLIGKLTGKRDDTGRTAVENAAEYCATNCGLPEYPQPLFAQRGDLVVVDGGTGELIAGLVGLSGYPVSVVSKGWIRLPMRSVRRAWRV